MGVGAASNREELFQQPLCCTSFISEAGAAARGWGGVGERNLFVLVRGMGETRELSSLCSLCSLCSLTVEASGERQYLPARDLQQIRQAVEVRGLPREMCAVALFLLEISVACKNG